jgi:hypothetical protein
MKKINKDSQQGTNNLSGGCLDHVDELVKRYYILSGSIRGGNQHSEIKNELSGVINKLVQTKQLTVEDAIRASKELIANV